MRLLATSKRLPVDAVLWQDRDPTWGHGPQGRHALSLVQQGHLAHDRPRANLGHRLAVDLHPQDAVEQQEQLIALFALLDQGPARLEAAEPRLGVDHGHRELAFQGRLHRGHDRGRVLRPQGVWLPNASRHQVSWSMNPLLAISRPVWS